ncbi:MAG: flippase-like domain-containing protein [Proteobacteria bacterium]|nr:flippase-like domain-containing protein [Pseudomonadota bacterium]
MSWLLALASALVFAALGFKAWTGHIGVLGIALLPTAAVLYFMARRGFEKVARNRADMVAKVAFTFVGIMALLRHPIAFETPEGVKTELPLYEAIGQYITEVDPQTFVFFALVAMAVKFVGVITSAFAWHLLLVGQGVRFPFWSKIFTAFLIGRFIGTFMPSTIGLDGYTLYEAGRYSGEWTRVITAKTLEKFIGITGLFLGMVLTMPFGYSVIVEVTAKLGAPDAAPMLAAGILLVAGGVSTVVVIGLVWPVLLVAIMGVVKRILNLLMVGPLAKISNKVLGLADDFTRAVGAYHGKVGLLMATLAAKFVTHFTTFVVYYFTGLAIGVVALEFWPVVFGSSIQVLATVLSPTIAGEGAREAFQALLLSNQYGGVAQAVLAGALGFIAAEAATMWGGLFLWTRTPGWRPKFAHVDGEQVDYAWISDDDGGFDAEAIQRRTREARQN